MKKHIRFFVIFLTFQGFVIFPQIAFAQKLTPFDSQGASGTSSAHAHTEKCAHTLIESQIEKEMGYFGTKDFFENWIDQKIASRRNNPQILSKTLNGPRLIPVVVHVIHDGSPVGTGTNIPDSQIIEQIRILNEDFRRLNADAIRTPAEFLPVAADANIEFVLAKQDPSGLPTSGIVRIQGPKSSYSPQTDAILIGQLSQWDPDEYMNMYSAALEQPFIGYASFPVSDLPGLNFAPNPTIIDGVTVDYRFFGVGGNSISASLGRTATHEVGHFFGLRHIWGDGGCGVDDFVDDTPEQDNSNTICNSNPSRFSCGSNDMVQNYMDYTPDACMNIFTQGQVDRFNVVLENSPRRLTLVNNRATQDPVLFDLDLALTRIIQPVDAICELTVTPEVEVRNVGNTAITSARIEFVRNGRIVESKRFQLSLQTGESEMVTFASSQLENGRNVVEFRITQVNDQTDQNINNNSKTSNPVLQGEIDLPYSFNIQNFPSEWIISNPDQSFTWERTNITIGGQSQQAVYIRHYEYEGINQLDYLISPIVDLGRYPNAQLVFEVAHAPYDQPGFLDELIVSVSEDCGTSFDLVDVNYLKSGQRLETSTPTLEEFVPTSNQQFRTEIFNLSEFKELGKVRIAFATRNSFGNNIYLRNIRILPNQELKYDIEVEEILVPNPINSGNHENEIIQITNMGNLPFSKFLFTRTTNNSLPETYLVSGLTVAPDDLVRLQIAKSTTGDKNKLQFRVSEPNFDQNPNTISSVTQYHLETTEAIQVPWRQNFNNSTNLAPWSTINPENDLQAWTVTPTANGAGVNNAAQLRNGSAGNSYWLSTPLFDLTKTNQASIFFDLAAGQMDQNSRLTLLASMDGGLNYSATWIATGPEIATVSAGEANPNSPGDYIRNYVDLSDFAGSEADSVRLAFVLETEGVDNDPVYLDNLELFLSANPDPIIPSQGSSILFPNPARDFFNLAFNLSSREDVKIQIISSTGSIVHEVNYPGTLNQTYTFSSEMFRSGIYIIRISSNSLSEMKRLILN